jgi:hypothetical protein
VIGLLLLWLALFAVLVGWGLLALVALRRLGGALSVFQTMWLGYAALLAFLLLCSLFLPIARGVLAMSLAPSIAGYALQRRVVLRRLRALRASRATLVTAGLLVLLAIVVAYLACDIVGWYDTGLYHQQAVKWTATYPTVPGLANLHIRFGYNNSVHVFAAYVDAFWQGVAAHATSGFLIGAVLAQWCVEIVSARTPRGRIRQRFCLLSLPFLLATLWRIDGEVASLSSDLALAAVSYVLVLELVSLERDRRLARIALIVALGAVACSTKLGGLALFAACSVLAVVAVWRASWRTRLLVFALPALVIGGWVTRGVILSGWLVFPVFGKLGLGWAVRSKTAHTHLHEIEAWGRMFGHGADEVFGRGTWFWLRPWLDAFRETKECLLAGISVALIAWRALHPRRAGELVAVIACVLGIAQWFVGSPDLRYGAYLFWLLAAVLLTALLATMPRRFVLAVALVGCAWSGGFAIRANAVVPEVFGRPPDVHVPPTERVDGVFRPTLTDQCFDAELPCTPTPSGVHMRGDSLDDGFVP